MSHLAGQLLNLIHDERTHVYMQGPPKKCIHTLTKENLCCMLVLTLILHHKLNTHYNRAQYKFPVPVQLMEVLKVVAVSG